LIDALHELVRNGDSTVSQVQQMQEGIRVVIDDVIGDNLSSYLPAESDELRSKIINDLLSHIFVSAVNRCNAEPQVLKKILSAFLKENEEGQKGISTALLNDVLRPFLKDGDLVGEKKDQFINLIKAIDGVVDINKTSYEGLSLFHWACKHGKMDVINLLVNNSKIDINSTSAIFYVKGEPYYEYDTKIKIEESFTEFNESLMSALGLACKYGHVDTAEFLIGKRANINDSDIFQQTPLHEACISNSVAVVELLLVHSSDVEVKDFSEATPLKQSYLSRNMTIFFLLLQSGATLNEDVTKAIGQDVKRLLSELEKECLVKLGAKEVPRVTDSSAKFLPQAIIRKIGEFTSEPNLTRLVDNHPLRQNWNEAQEIATRIQQRKALITPPQSACNSRSASPVSSKRMCVMTRGGGD
jgi:ankyrin repeat protein